MKNLKKGFTIIELVLILAIGLTLAGVIVCSVQVGFMSSDEAVDKTNVTNLNLSIQKHKKETGKLDLSTEDDFYLFFNTLDYSANTLKVNRMNRHYVYLINSGIISYVNNDNKVLFPKEYTDYLITSSNSYIVTDQNYLDYLGK